MYRHTDGYYRSRRNSFGISAFENCTGLTGVYISDVAAWCRIYFGGNKASPLEYAHNLYLNGALVTNLVIPGGVTKVGDYAFEHCMSITSVTIPEGCTTIGEYAFNNCQNITSATLPNSLTTGSFAFASCARMHATLPGGITYIGERLSTALPCLRISLLIRASSASVPSTHAAR